MAADYFFDNEAAAKAERFFAEYCTFVDGPMQGQPLKLLEWQAARLVRPVFGWKRASDGSRRYRTVYLFVPKKNAKSAFGTAVSLYLSQADGEASPYVYCVAGSVKQSKIVFDEARKMVDQHPVLSSMCTPQLNRIVSPWNSGVVQVLAADAELSHGVKASAVIFDELHVQRSDRLYLALKGAGAARFQPLHIYMTTAGDRREGPWWELYQYGKRVLSGEIDDPTFLPIIYEAESSAPTWEVGTWLRANPSLQRPGQKQKQGEYSISMERMEDLARTARNGSPSDIRSFRQLHLNIGGEPEAGYYALEKWDACDDAIELEELRQRKCWAGVDLSNVSDITSVALVFEPDRFGVTAVLSYNFLPVETVKERSRRANVPFDRWVKEEYLEVTPGDAISRDQVYNRIRQLATGFRVMGVGIDPYKADELGTAIEASGVPVVEIRQNHSGLSEATKESETLILLQKIAHGGNPVLRFAIQNAVARSDDAGNVMLSKKRSPEKIDPAAAMINALATRALAPPPPAPSVYESGGLLVSTVDEEQQT